MGASLSHEKEAEVHIEKILLALRNISHISSMYSKYLQRHLNITSAQLLFLRALYFEDQLSAGEIGRRIFMKPGTVTGVMDRLESKGLVARVRNSPDRRVVRVTITEDGRRMVEATPAPLQSRLAENLRKIPMDEVKGVSRTLDRLIELMQAAEATREINEADSEYEVF
ncbi:MAG: MarR family transcriptional regulator [Thermodesulfobacteriota bacterium]